MSIQELIKEYEKIRVKYKLPSFDYLNEEFEIRSIKIEEQGTLIKAILRAITNKISVFMSILESVIDPSRQTMHDMIEKSNITNEEKQKMFVIYKKLGKLYHESFLVFLQNENEIASYINSLIKEWPKIKEKQISFTKQIVKSWEKED